MLIVTPIVGFCKCSMFCCALLLCNYLDGEKRAGALLSLSSCCVALARGAMGLFAVCECGIS